LYITEEFEKMFFSYTPHIYTKEDWKTHKKIFIVIQLIPLILSAAFVYLQEGADMAMVYGFVAPLSSTWYYILTILNIAVYVLAIYENKRHIVSVEEEGIS
jgi:hypothetical protein